MNIARHPFDWVPTPELIEGSILSRWSVRPFVARVRAICPL